MEIIFFLLCAVSASSIRFRKFMTYSTNKFKNDTVCKDLPGCKPNHKPDLLELLEIEQGRQTPQMSHPDKSHLQTDHPFERTKSRSRRNFIYLSKKMRRNRVNVCSNYIAAKYGIVWNSAIYSYLS